MSADSYQPFRPSRSTPRPNASSAVTACHRPVPAVSPPQNGFEDWGKGAEFREFQRLRKQSVTTVTAFPENVPWGDGLMGLLALPKPHFLRAPDWEELLFDCVRFCNEWGQQASDLGWTEIELFGCNRNPQARRLDNNGLVITLHGRRVLSIVEGSATIDAGRGDIQTYRRGFPMETSVPLWAAFSQESGP